MPQPIQFCGEQITLAASAARTASASGTTFPIAAGRSRFMVACIVADASTTDAGDTLDVYVDLSPDGGTTWVNAIHFTQRAGNAAGAKTEVAVLDSASASTSVVDSGDHNSSHTFGVTAFAM